MNKKNILTLGLTAALTLSLAACGGDSAQSAAPSDAAESAAVESAAPAEPTVVTVGVVGANNGQWDTVNELLADDNIKVELVEFSEYKLPNEALNAGEIDMNAFQHKAYLAKDAGRNGYDVTAIGDTVIAPLSLFSKQFKSLDELKAAAGPAKK